MSIHIGITQPRVQTSCDQTKKKNGEPWNENVDLKGLSEITCYIFERISESKLSHH